MIPLSPPVLLLIFVVGPFTVGLYLTLLLARRMPFKAGKSSNDATSATFVITGGFYALLLSFAVSQEWDQYNEARTAADMEGSVARHFYRCLGTHPDTAHVATLRQPYLKYIHFVVEQEYPRLRSLRPVSVKDQLQYQALLGTLERICKHDSHLASMVEYVNRLDTYHNMRLANAGLTIPGALWLALLLGAFLTLLCGLLLHLEDNRMHGLLSGLMCAFMGMVFFILVAIDSPYTGPFGIQPRDFIDILMQAQEGTANGY